MRFQLLISCNNAAFSDGETANETARILKAASDTLAQGHALFEVGSETGLWDHNGNRVGSFAFIQEDE